MNQLADELKEIVGNYTGIFTILESEDLVNLYMRDIVSPLMYDIIVLSKSLNYGFIIKQGMYLDNLYLEVKIEFYKTL
jgi:hypothetical protein